MNISQKMEKHKKFRDCKVDVMKSEKISDENTPRTFLVIGWC